MTTDQPETPMEHVETLSSAVRINPGHVWTPTIGEELTGLLQHSKLDEQGVDRVRRQAVAVLGHTLDPQANGPARRTGLVIGYVQSGKTLSFTSVIALAHDNNFRLVILFSGTKDNLHQQTHGRLQRDLRVTREGGSPWLLYDNPMVGSAAVAEIRAALQASPSPGPTSNPLLKAFSNTHRTVVITVMKNSTRLNNARSLMNELNGYGLDLAAIPVLIVDDEADQAGLNTRAGDEDDPSATYASILELRSSLPRHSYLQYTATPQAPLLLDLVSTLSPDFVGVLEPGEGYTGGKYFFRDHADRFTRLIPAAEARTALDEDGPPPESLKAALASYLVATLLMGTRGISPSSMLVHPSHTKDQHDKFANWVRALRDTWRELLALPAEAELRTELLGAYINPACDDLAQGAPELADPTHLIEGIRYVLDSLQVRVVNSAGLSDANIDFDRFPFWILVGGNKLDRGYTVAGLVTTYMPRGVGGGQADTIQQRARFFGYKGGYGDLCRAWLVGSTAEIYRRYIEHEEALRAELSRLADNGTPLHQWRRRLLIDASLRPCRANVIGLPYVRERVRGGAWARFERLAVDEDLVAENREGVDGFLQTRRASFTPDPDDPRPERVNEFLILPLAELVEHLLAGWRMDSVDEARLGTVLLLLRSRLDEQPGLEAQLQLMDGYANRIRSLDPGQRVKVNNLFQGRSSVKGERYPGDQAFRSADDLTVTVQLHRVDVREEQGVEPFLVDTPALAFWVPRRLASDLILGVE